MKYDRLILVTDARSVAVGLLPRFILVVRTIEVGQQHPTFVRHAAAVDMFGSRKQRNRTWSRSKRMIDQSIVEQLGVCKQRFCECGHCVEALDHIEAQAAEIERLKHFVKLCDEHGQAWRRHLGLGGSEKSHAVDSFLVLRRYLDAELTGLRESHKHCDLCGGTWLDDGINSGCYCVEISRLRAVVEKHQMDRVAETVTGVQIGSLGHKLWVCIDGCCVLRVKSPVIELTDSRSRKVKRAVQAAATTKGSGYDTRAFAKATRRLKPKGPGAA